MANSANQEAKLFTIECTITAMIELLKEKSYNDITLSEIAKKAGVSRNAIYRNFETKDMILRKYANGLTYDFIDKLKSTGIKTYEDYVISLVNHLCSQKDLALVLYKSDLINILLESFLQMKGLFETEISIKEYYENFRIGGIFFIYLTWIQNGCKESAYELIQIILNVANHESLIPNFLNCTVLRGDIISKIYF